jgi:hypothetical protein
LGVSEPALARCAGLPDNTICTTGGNPYASGINVDTNNGLGGTPINLTLLQGVNVVPAGPGDAINAANTTGVTPGSANISINWRIVREVRRENGFCGQKPYSFRFDSKCPR